ncbi:hypothetical protein D3C87_1063450 [compost metagenome]
MFFVDAEGGTFGLDGGIAVEVADGDEQAEDGGEFGEFGKQGLEGEGGACGVEADGQVVERDVADGVADFLGAFGVGGEGLQVGDQHGHGVGLLQVESAAEGAHEVAEVELAGRAIARHHALGHAPRVTGARGGCKRRTSLPPVFKGGVRRVRG